jgi:hypothetical protein
MKKETMHMRKRKSLEEMKDLLRRKLPDLRRTHGVETLELFGSWIWGEQTGQSDLDILVGFDPARKISLFDLVSLEEELSAYLGVKVDLVERDSVKPALRNRIMNEAVPL